MDRLKEMTGLYKLFHRVLADMLDLPASMNLQRKEELYAYAFELAKPDPRRGQRILVTEGYTADSIYFLISGSCRFYYYSETYKQELVPFLMLSPCLLAEGKSFQKDLPARYNIEVSKSSVVLKLNKIAILAIVEKYPEVEPAIRLLVKQQNLEFKTWKKGLWMQPAEARYKQLRDTSTDLIQSMQKKDIAAHLAIKNPSFSRLLKRLGDTLCFL